MDHIQMSLERYERLKELQDENKRLVRGLKSFRLRGADEYIKERTERMYYNETEATKRFLSIIKAQQRLIREKNGKIQKLEERNLYLGLEISLRQVKKSWSSKILKWI